MICVIAFSVFCYSGYQVFLIIQSRSIAANHYETYTDFVEEITESTEKSSDKKSDKASDEKYVDNTVYKDLNISIDFKNLTAKYPDSIGWLYFSNGTISYPVMQSVDNSYYLNRLPDGRENASGSIFADCRNTVPEEDRNTIIYGHNMMNNTMFGGLDRYRSQDYYDHNPVFYYLTPEKTYKADIIAGVTVDYKSDIYRTDLQDDRLYALMKELTAKSTFKAKKEYKKGDRIITLSTCYATDQTRYVLIGVISD